MSNNTMIYVCHVFVPLQYHDYLCVQYLMCCNALIRHMFIPTGYQAIHPPEKPLSWKAHL